MLVYCLLRCLEPSLVYLYCFIDNLSGFENVSLTIGSYFRGEADEKTIRWFEKRFHKHASSEEELDKEKFILAINNDQVRYFGIMGSSRDKVGARPWARSWEKLG